ncbi:hypothetical protein PHACT_07945 [Pseudohongiella acticola]|jgi:hypothetical protein|uniref:Uncharacterized protein n=1 Tax=Pseudohongiella acticola TaxID=1524254 RepID=A0A1E8CKY6_9GAMM|nr:hypothetical protein [Pseudohongiella acticola]OFE13078.1 hypothetical protein PHACT_07945 [Pseudohongiella acticola]|tara:strand:- start:153 stop:728 length:576 start_codon:yes stop_codon:yes gene_type:complete
MLTVAAIALLLNGAGVGLLYLSWRDRADSKKWRVPAAWALLALAMWVWTLASGVEFGVVQVFLVSAVLAWLLVLFNARKRSPDRAARRELSDRPAIASSAGLALPNASAFARQCWLFIVVVPLAGAASALATTALAQLLPWQQGDRLVLTLYAMPAVWGVACWWACAVPKSYWPALTFTLAMLVSFLVLYG